MIDGMATFHFDASVTGDASLIIAQGSMVDGEGNVDVNVLNSGELAPGFSPGLFLIGEDYGQTSSGLLDIELAGLVRGDEFDALLVAGDMRLAGSLVVDLIDGFVPSPGNMFDIMDFATLIGEFDTLQLADLPNNWSWNTSKLYVTGEIWVVPEPAAWTLGLIGVTAQLFFRRGRFPAATK